MGFKNFSRGQYDAVAHPEKMDSGQISRTRWALAIFIIVLLTGAITLGVINNQKPGQQDAGPAPVPTIEYTAGAGEPSGDCLDNTDIDISTTAPKVEQWLAKASGQVPVIKGAGPCGKAVGEVDTGFAKTQTGALSAATHWAWQLFTAPATTSTPESIRAVTVAGSDRDALEAQAKRVLSGAEAPETDYRSITHLAGYRIQIQGETALVDIAAVSQVGAEKINITTRVTLRWEEDDWKVVPAGADTFARGTKLADLTGFVPFSAEVSDAAR